jgi:uncharacterized protein
LDDYACYIEALILMQEITGDQAYLHKAKNYTAYVFEHFSDEEDNLFYYTGVSQKDIILRKTEVYDGATPSANAVMAGNLFYLALIFDEPGYRRRAEKMLRSLYPAIEKYPGSFGFWAGIYLREAAGVVEIAVTGTSTGSILKEILQEFIPNKALQSTGSGKPEAMPLLENKATGDKPAIYVCRNYSCLAPVFTVKEMAGLIKNHPNSRETPQ